MKYSRIITGLTVSLLATACSSQFAPKTGLIYDSSKDQPGLNYDSIQRPYSDKLPLSPNAAAARWLADTQITIELSGSNNMKAALSFFLAKLREAGATVETTFPIAGVSYDGLPLPYRLSARDMLNNVVGNLDLDYVATYDTKGRPYIKLHKKSVHSELRPTQSRPSGLLEGIEIRHGESLISITQRLAADKGYRDVIFDFKPSSMPPHSIIAPFSGILQGDGVNGLLRELAAQFSPAVPNLQFTEAKNAFGYSLIVTDRGFQDWETLRVFEVRATTISENVKHLADFYGWRVDRDGGWRLDTDYEIVAPYKIAVSDVHQAFSRLLEGYPVKANLVGSTQTAFFVSRPMPIARMGESN